MIKIVHFLLMIALSCYISYSFADDTVQQLQAKLNSFENLSASFTQEAKDKQNQLLSSSHGHLYIKKPLQFLMHTTEPDETYLYTKADGIYYYDSFLEQLSIYPLANLDEQPFVLLYKQNQSLWDKYSISKEQDNFVLKPKNKNNLEQVILTFKGNHIAMIKLYMKDGIINTYTFSDVSFKVDASNFQVKLEENIEINDER